MINDKNLQILILEFTTLIDMLGNCGLRLLLCPFQEVWLLDQNIHQRWRGRGNTNRDEAIGSSRINGPIHSSRKLLHEFSFF